MTKLVGPMKHTCNKEREFGEIQTNLHNISEKVSDIHSMLLGKDGKDGVISEFNQVKGTIKFIQWVTGIWMTLLSLLVGYLIRGR